MRNKIVTTVVAGGLLVGAGLVTSLVSSPEVALAQEEVEAGDDRGPIPRIIGFLEEVLEELVGEGTITEEQADAILAATEAKAEEVKAEARERHELIKSLLEDDVITEEEAAQLPEDAWVLRDRFDEAWEDGELTSDEIVEFGPHLRRHPFRFGFRLGAHFGEEGSA
jgi:hypothetical protein